MFRKNDCGTNCFDAHKNNCIEHVPSMENKKYYGQNQRAFNLPSVCKIVLNTIQQIMTESMSGQAYDITIIAKCQ